MGSTRLCAAHETSRAAWPRQCRAPQLTARVMGLRSTHGAQPFSRACGSGVAQGGTAGRHSRVAQQGGRSEAQRFTLGAWFPGWHRPGRRDTERQQAARTGDAPRVPAVPSGRRGAGTAGQVPHASQGGCTGPGEVWGSPAAPPAERTGPGSSADTGMSSTGCQGGAARAAHPPRGRETRARPRRTGDAAGPGAAPCRCRGAGPALPCAPARPCPCPPAAPAPPPPRSPGTGGFRSAHLPARQPRLGVPELGRLEAVHGAPAVPLRAVPSPARPGPAAPPAPSPAPDRLRPWPGPAGPLTCVPCLRCHREWGTDPQPRLLGPPPEPPVPAPGPALG